MTAKTLNRQVANPDLGALRVGYEGDKIVARRTSFWSEVASKRNKDGTVSLILISPGIYPLDLLVTHRNGGRAIVVNDGQHEYVFAETQVAARPAGE